MITDINRRHLNLIRGGVPSTATHVDTHREPPPAERSPLARNVETLVIDAYNAGLSHGEPRHYRKGWRFGVLCGMLPGALAGGGAVALLQWLSGAAR